MKVFCLVFEYVLGLLKIEKFSVHFRGYGELCCCQCLFFFFFFNDPATTEIYTLSLHDALPILDYYADRAETFLAPRKLPESPGARSEEHTAELPSRGELVFRLPLQTKKKK